MSNRLTLCRAIQKQKIATIDDLSDLIPEWKRKKIQDTAIDLCKAGLAERKRDDVTGLPAYELTKAGKTFIEQSTKTQAPALVSPPASGGEITGSTAPASRVAGGQRTGLSTGGSAGHKPTGDEGNASPVAVDIPTTEEYSEVKMPTDKECCNAARVVATTAGSEVDKLIQKLQLAEKERDTLKSKLDLTDKSFNSLASAHRKFCEWVGSLELGVFPMNMHECQLLLMNALKPAEKAASTVEGQPLKYGIAWPSDFFPTSEAALEEISRNCDSESAKEAFIVTMRPIGKINFKPVILPLKEAA